MPRKTIDKDAKKEEMDGGVGKNLGKKDERKTSSVRNAGIQKPRGRTTNTIHMEVEEDPLEELMKSFGKTTIGRRQPSTMGKTKRLVATHPPTAILPLSGPKARRSMREQAMQQIKTDVEMSSHDEPSSSTRKASRAATAIAKGKEDVDYTAVIDMDNKKVYELTNTILYDKKGAAPAACKELIDIYTVAKGYLEQKITTINNSNKTIVSIDDLADMLLDTTITTESSEKPQMLIKNPTKLRQLYAISKSARDPIMKTDTLKKLLEIYKEAILHLDMEIGRVEQACRLIERDMAGPSSSMGMDETSGGKKKKALVNKKEAVPKEKKAKAPAKEKNN